MLIKPNDKLGFYTVGHQRVESKIEACILGTQTNQHPSWHFNDQVWNSINWKHEPEIDLLELYKIRAKQIREQYDYVIVNYSGGSDSHALVESFLDAGCFIDEIVTVWNRDHTPKVITDPNVTDAQNIEAEFELTTRPGLNWIKNQSPNTKITYLDVSNATVNAYKSFDGEEWITTANEYLHPQFITRWSATREKHQKLTLDRGLRTAVVFGVDKPKLTIKDGKYCVFFVDNIPNSFTGGFNDLSYTNLETVFFYWTPDLPEIVVKQAHMIKKWFDANSALKLVIHWPNHDYNKRQAYEIISRSIVYPNWDLGKFQCKKVSSTITSEWDQWFFQHYKDSLIYECWRKGINYVENSIDKKYLRYTFDNKFDGFVGMINGHFYLE